MPLPFALGLLGLAGTGQYAYDKYRDWRAGNANERAARQQQQRAGQLMGLLGSPEQAYQMSDAEMFPGEQPIQGLQTKGTGLLGGEIGMPQFMAKMAAIPGYEGVGVKGLLDTITPDAESGFTLGTGQTRYDAQGRQIASGGADLTQLERQLTAAGYTPGTPEFRDIMERAILKPGTQVNVNQGGPTTPGWKKVDEKFAEQFTSWNLGGGFTDTQKQLDQLGLAVDSLEKGVTTGFGAGLLPDSIKALVNPKLLDVKQSVQEVVQRNLREILGAQFTEKEGEKLIARAFDESLGTSVNIRRVKRLMQQIGDAAQAKQEAMEYFGAHGTMEGFSGKMYSMADFSADKLFSDGAKQSDAAGVSGWSIKRKGK